MIPPKQIANKHKNLIPSVARRRRRWLSWTPLQLLLMLLISRAGAQQLPPQLEEAQQVDPTSSRPRCLFDDRMNSLRCRETDYRTVQKSVNEIIFEISILDINFCDLRAISSPLLADNRTMSKLTTVSIVNSGVESMGEDTFKGLEEQLEHLDLSGNDLEQIPKAVLNLSKLIALDLSRNRILALPHGSAFNNMITLVTLNLAENL